MTADRDREPLRLAIAGTGFIGEMHARNAAASDAIALVAVASARGVTDSAKRLAAELGAGTRAVTLDQLWHDDEVEAVLVATRTTDHVEHAIAVLRSGKHLLLEKPGATTIVEHNRIAAAAAQRGDLVVRVAYHRRHDPRYRELAEIIAGGAIGEPFAVHSISRETYPPSEADRYSGGFVTDVGVHDFDTARWLLGEDPRTVYARAHTPVYPSTAGDNLYITIGYDRAVTTVELSRTSAVGHDIRFEVVGTDGSALLTASPLHSGITIINHSRTHEFPDDCRAAFPDAYRAELVDFAAACRGADAQGATLDDDWWALATAIAADASVARGAALAVDAE